MRPHFRHIIPISAVIATILLLCNCTRGGNKASSDSAGIESHAEVPAAVDSTVASAASTKAESLTFAFTGDIMTGTTFPDSVNNSHIPADEGRHLFENVKEILRRADIAAGNLEGVIAPILTGSPKKCKDPNLCYAFRMPEYMTVRIKDAGFDFLNVANNHSNDFGIEGLNSTLANLEESGMAYAGVAGRCPTAVIEKNGLKIGFASFAPGGYAPSVNDYSRLRSTVERLRGDCDIIVVSMHAGAEGAGYSRTPEEEEIFHGEKRGNVRKFAHEAIDAGADIVWGHGPHVVRGAELYKNRIVMYSLGNFCTPYRMSLSGLCGEAPIAEIRVDSEGKFLDGKIHSFLQRHGAGPAADPAGKAALQIRNLSRLDFPDSPLNISESGELTR